MGKEQAKPGFAAAPPAGSASDIVQELAGRLFEKCWLPRGQVNDAGLAAMCFKGAQEFFKVASRIREGATAEELLNPQPLPDEISIKQGENASVAA